MDRESQSLDEQVLPPPEPKTVYTYGLAGVAACALAAVLNFAGEESPVSTLRLLLVAGGCLAAGGAITLRPSLPFAWFIAAIAFLFAWPGLPAHWDSARYVAAVGAGIGLAGTFLSALPRGWRYSLISAMALWHFSSIFIATTWPDPTPWTTQQLGQRVYLPYLAFMYLRNAYHFYSPNPGPASHLFALVKYDTIDPQTRRPVAEWISLPNRDKDVKDPLGLTYYRRLSITEQASQAMPPPMYTFEANEITRRRMKARGDLGGYPNYPRIPLAPEEFEPASQQYRMPRPDIIRYLLPSYAAHILKHEGTPGLGTPVSVKLYRLEHRVTPAYYFAKGAHEDPGHFQHNLVEHPSTFRPYYLGEFAENPRTGKVEPVDPQDPMLYWLVPILPMPVSPNDPQRLNYHDYMSEHAGYTYDWQARLKGMK